MLMPVRIQAWLNIYTTQLWVKLKYKQQLPCLPAIELAVSSSVDVESFTDMILATTDLGACSSDQTVGCAWSELPTARNGLAKACYVKRRLRKKGTDTQMWTPIEPKWLRVVLMMMVTMLKIMTRITITVTIAMLTMTMIVLVHFSKPVHVIPLTGDKTG